MTASNVVPTTRHGLPTRRQLFVTLPEPCRSLGGRNFTAKAPARIESLALVAQRDSCGTAVANAARRPPRERRLDGVQEQVKERPNDRLDDRLHYGRRSPLSERCDDEHVDGQHDEEGAETAFTGLSANERASCGHHCSMTQRSSLPCAADDVLLQVTPLEGSGRRDEVRSPVQEFTIP